MREIPWTVVRGFFMGSADVVPGVSGGTIALVLGIYERLIASVRAGSSALGWIFRLDRRKVMEWLRRVEWSFILPLLGGIVIAVGALAGILEDQLHERPVQLAALFLGLVAGSVFVTWQILRTRDGLRLLVLSGTAIAVFVLLGLRPGTAADTVTQLDDVSLIAFFLSGAIAICAMILPGISGSFLLVVLGMYGPVLGAVNDRDAVSLIVFAIGAVVGLAVFSQFLYWALSHHHDTVIAVLIGLMLGSLRVLWPWPTGVSSTEIGVPDEAVFAAIVLVVVGSLAVIGLSVVAKRVDGRVGEVRTTSAD